MFCSLVRVIFKGTVKGKMKGAETWESQELIYKRELMFLSREIGIKLCQNYTKTYICKIRSIKQIIFNKYATNLKKTKSQRSLKMSSLLIFRVAKTFLNPSVQKSVHFQKKSVQSVQFSKKIPFLKKKTH